MNKKNQRVCLLLNAVQEKLERREKLSFEIGKGIEK